MQIKIQNFLLHLSNINFENYHISEHILDICEKCQILFQT